MYWRGGLGFVLLWIASVALAVAALTALARASSSGAALSFLAAGAVLAPPVQEFIARWLNPLAPPKAALILCSTLILLGLGYVVVDGAVAIDRQAKRLGFSSGGEWARATDLKLTTPQQLAAHDAAEQRKVSERLCRDRLAHPPLFCFDPVHQRAALAYARKRLPDAQLEAVVRDALAQQRKSYLAADKACSELLDRIDEEALPFVLSNRHTVLSFAGGAWARHLQAGELERLLAATTGTAASLSTSDARALEQKVSALGSTVENELQVQVQTWARQIVLDEPSWRTFLKGHMPLPECKPAMAAKSNGDVRIAAPN